MMFLPRTLYGVIGDPIGQSLSPSLHNTAFQVLGLEAAFLAWHIAPEKLADFVQAARTLPIAGVCVTIPHKEKIIPFLDELTPVARHAGAVNTLFWREGRLIGHNTDVEGFLAPLISRPPAAPPFASALVLGAGGAARAVLAGLMGLTGLAGPLGGSEPRERKKIWLCARRVEQAQGLADFFAPNTVETTDATGAPQIVVLPWEERHSVSADLIVNTTPVGMKSGGYSPQTIEAESPLTRFAPRRPACLAYDLIYQNTPFLQDACAAGWPTLDGSAMFAAQGAAQFRLWTGHEMPEAAFAALKKAP